MSLKELNPQDKKRVANLVKELAKVGEERVHAEKRLQEERTAFEERLAILQEEYDAVIKEKHCIHTSLIFYYYPLYYCLQAAGGGDLPP